VFPSVLVAAVQDNGGRFGVRVGREAAADDPAVLLGQVGDLLAAEDLMDVVSGIRLAWDERHWQTAFNMTAHTAHPGTFGSIYGWSFTATTILNLADRMDRRKSVKIRPLSMALGESLFKEYVRGSWSL
jgi:hypothetical protein